MRATTTASPLKRRGGCRPVPRRLRVGGGPSASGPPKCGGNVRIVRPPDALALANGRGVAIHGRCLTLPEQLCDERGLPRGIRLSVARKTRSKRALERGVVLA